MHTESLVILTNLAKSVCSQDCLPCSSHLLQLVVLLQPLHITSMTQTWILKAAIASTLSTARDLPTELCPLHRPDTKTGANYSKR